MNTRHMVWYALAAGMLIGVNGCGERNVSESGVRQTRFPGQVTAGGGTSGEVLGRVGQIQEGTYAGGTPGIAGGSGGNTGGAATGGAVQESGRGPSTGVTKEGMTAGGTPGIAGGSGGNTGGTATGGTVQESGSGPSQGVTPVVPPAQPSSRPQ